MNFIIEDDEEMLLSLAKKFTSAHKDKSKTGETSKINSTKKPEMQNIKMKNKMSTDKDKESIHAKKVKRTFIAHFLYIDF